MIPYIPLKLDKVYNLRFGMAAAYEFEKLSKIKVTRIDLQQFSIMEIAQLLWAMMRQDNKELTLDQALSLVDEYAENMNDVIAAVAEAIQAAFDTGEKSKNAQAPVNG